MPCGRNGEHRTGDQCDNGCRRQQADPVARGPKDAGRGPDAPEDGRVDVDAGRVVEVLAEVDERTFEIDHNTTSSPSRDRNWSNARDRRDFTVPGGHDRTSAVSLSLSPAK